jgi:hypothetical protein
MIEVLDGKYICNQDPAFIPISLFGNEVAREILMEKGVCLRNRDKNIHFPEYHHENWWIHIYE